MNPGRSSFYSRKCKRMLDLTIGLVVGVATLPLQILLALVVRRKLGSPVLFKQERPGKDATPFTMLKFRTMTDARGPDGALLSDDERLTPFGAALRSTSLDELPELYNVIRGDMSLVGPRPLLMRYLDRYTSQQVRRHEVRPGITGLAQVSGRNRLSWDEKFDLDIEYVEQVSLRLDISILARTFKSVFLRHDVAAQDEATAPEFMGSSDETWSVRG